jgi:hypothetical protein
LEITLAEMPSVVAPALSAAFAIPRKENKIQKIKYFIIKAPLIVNFFIDTPKTQFMSVKLSYWKKHLLNINIIAQIFFLFLGLI